MFVNVISLILYPIFINKLQSQMVTSIISVSFHAYVHKAISCLLFIQLPFIPFNRTLASCYPTCCWKWTCCDPSDAVPDLHPGLSYTKKLVAMVIISIFLKPFNGGCVQRLIIWRGGAEAGLIVWGTVMTIEFCKSHISCTCMYPSNFLPINIQELWSGQLA